jgi:hypothetical protein
MELVNTLMHNPLVLVLLSGLTVLFLMFIEGKISKTNRDNTTYYKNVGLLSTLVGLSLFSSKFNFGDLKTPQLPSMTDNKQEQPAHQKTKDEYEFSNEKFDD